MIRIIITLTFLAWSSHANAYCPEPSFFFGKSFETKVNDNFKHLICLHNEQVATLNEHAIEINRVSDTVERLGTYNANVKPANNNGDLRKLLARYENLAVENVFLKARLDAIEKQLSKIKNQN